MLLLWVRWGHGGGHGPTTLLVIFIPLVDLRVFFPAPDESNRDSLDVQMY